VFEVDAAVAAVAEDVLAEDVVAEDVVDDEDEVVVAVVGATVVGVVDAEVEPEAAGLAAVAAVCVVLVEAWEAGAVAPKYPVKPATPATLITPVTILARLAGWGRLRFMTGWLTGFPPEGWVSLMTPMIGTVPQSSLGARSVPPGTSRSSRRGVERQVKGKDRPTTRSVARGRGASVLGGDARNDGQAEAGASANPRLVGLPEAIERVSESLGVEAAAVVADRHPGGAIGQPGAHLDWGPGRRVTDRVGDEIGDRLSEVGLVASDDDRLRGVEGDVAIGRRGDRVAARIRGKYGEIDRRPFRGPSLIEAR
jgi:hypothetical protein